MPKAQTDAGRFMQGRRTRKTQLSMHQRGRTTKLNPEVSKRICDAVRAGNFLHVAARYGGVSFATLMVWLDRGRRAKSRTGPDGIYLTFLEDVEAAEAGAEVAAVLHWRSAMPKDWKAAQKWLEITHRDRWAFQPDPSAPNAAFAGVNVNIGLTDGRNSAEGAVNASQQPLEQLLEQNPDLIASTMQVLDTLLPISSEYEQTDTDDVEMGPFARLGDGNELNGHQSSVIDAEEGSWTTLDANEDEDA